MGIYDLCIIGGGINGVGIALDAASRGLSVILCEQHDLGGATSSASSKLIHGGLRYLEYGEFRLVRKALQEREVLLKIAPHLIEELRFILLHEKHHRPASLIRLGLFLYDHLAKRKTIRRSESIKTAILPFKDALQPHLQRAFLYSDCKVDDARLVISIALKAKTLGARILTRHTCTHAQRADGTWKIDIQNAQTQQTARIQAKALVNATGPWANQFLDSALHIPKHYQMKLVQGSHIVVPKLYEGSEAFILQNKDKRIIFVIPYQDQFSLIGTTEIDFEGELAHPDIQQREIDYLLKSIDEYFKKVLRQEDIIWHYTGVRPLINEQNAEASAISRDYILELQDEAHLPLLNVYSGKITTYRKLAIDAIKKLKPYFPHLPKGKTKALVLVGGDFPTSKENYLANLQHHYPWLDQAILKRYINAYGTCTLTLLKDCRSIEDLGHHFGAGLYEKEIHYLIEEEWAQTVDDIIWRRSKLGLFLTKKEVAALQTYLIEASPLP